MKGRRIVEVYGTLRRSTSLMPSARSTELSRLTSTRCTSDDAKHLSLIEGFMVLYCAAFSLGKRVEFPAMFG